MNKKHEVIDCGMVGQTAIGMYKIAIVDGKTKQVKWEQKEWRHNLILNSGLTMVATNFWTACMAYCYAGLGTDVNSVDSSTDTASSNAAGDVTSVGATINFTSFSVGDCILFDDGSQGRISAIGGANACTIVPAPGGSGIASQEFTVCKTSRNKLTGNFKRCESYLPNSPNAISQRQSNVCLSRLTYDFAEETGTVVIGELGLSVTSAGSTSVWTAAGSNPVLFSRIVLPAPLTLNSGDSLRVVYQLQVTILPVGTAISSPTITGWPTAGTTQGTFSLRQVGLSTISTVATSPGNAVAAFDSYSNEPSAHGSFSPGTHLLWVDKTALGFSFTWPASGVARANYIRPTRVPYVTTNTDFTGLTYSQTKESTWAIGEANVGSWGSVRAIGHGFYSTFISATSDPTVNCGAYFEFDTAQDKTNVQKLTLRFKYSWSRTLTVD